MKSLTINSPAKVNLSLDILGKADDGYHQIKSIIHEYSELSDLVKIETTHHPDNTSTIFEAPKNGNCRILEGQENLAHHALTLFKDHFKITQNFKVTIQKNIPIASGLGGASSNAATVLRGLNQILDLGKTAEDLIPLAVKLGMDVPFFLEGGTVLAEGYGEKLTPLPTIKNLKIKILPHSEWPQFPPHLDLERKTSSMYQLLDLEKCGKHTGKTDKLIELIQGDHTLQDLKILLHNDFETIMPVHAGLHLSGAGNAVFCIEN